MKRLVSVLALVLIAAPASAQIRIDLPGKRISSSQANSTLERLNSRLKRGIKLANRPFGKDPQRELKDIEAAAAIAVAVDDQLTVDLRLGGSNFDVVQDNLALLRKRIPLARLQHACSSTRMVVLDKNRGGQVGSDEDLAAFDRAVAVLEAQMDDARVVRFWKEAATTVRADQAGVAERGAQKAAAAAKRAHEKEVHAIRQGVRALDKEILGLMKANENPIPEDRLQAYRAAIDAVKGVAPDGAAFYESQLRRFGIYNAFFTRDPARVAQAVGGELVAGGTTKGKAMKVSFGARAGWCYSLWNRWRSDSGGEKINEFKWLAKSRSRLQRYHLWSRSVPWETTRGVCVVVDQKVTATADLVFAGTRNGVEYAVVGWPKASFPVEEAVDIGVWPGDKCDVDAWKAIWLDPIPGTIVWRGKEAFLLSSPDRAGQLWVTMTNVTGSDRVRARKPELTDAGPADRAFRTQLSVPRCGSTSTSTHKLSTRHAKCDERQDAKYDKLWDQARRAKERARTIGSYRAAERRLDRLGDQQRKEWNSRCGPTRRKIEKLWRAAYDSIVDRYIDAPPPPSIPRAARLAAEDDY